MDFVFSTKAETLERLRGKLKHSDILPSVIFTVKDWDSQKTKIIEQIRKLDPLVIVRSSALNEDTATSSMAGNYESIPNIDSSSDELVKKAVDSVIKSYTKDCEQDDNNQVLVQPMVQTVQMSGVVFTEDLETGAPYYIISYDDYSGKTDIITAGIGNHKIFTFCKLYTKLPSDPHIKKILEAVQELEKVTGTTAIDIEFVLSDDTFYLLQARPIATVKNPIPHTDNDFKKTLEGIKTFLTGTFQKFPNLVGETTAYGIMPDWNPAEIVGVDAKPLAFSLYRYLITDEVWPKSRKLCGYRDVGRQPGICSLAGKPYVDVRMSFNTFTPATISDATAEKLIDFFVMKLRRYQDFHDKVEFNIVYSSYTFDIERIENEMKENGFNDKEVSEVKTALFNLSNNILTEKTVSIRDEMNQTNILQEKREQIVKANIPLVTKIVQLGHDCCIYGTLPFSTLARLGFIANILLKSLLAQDIISQEEHDQFFGSIETVATEFLDRLADLKSEKITTDEFLTQYGHLRPGTYDITSRTYAEAFDEYIDIDNFKPMTKSGTYELGEETKAKIQKELKRHNFGINSEQLLIFIREATMAREKCKLEFTKNLSLMLTYITEILDSYGISREDAAFVEYEDIVELSNSSLSHNSIDALKEKIDSNKRKYTMTKLIQLPPLIFLERSVQYFRSTDVMPNYITQKTVCAEVVNLTKDIEQDITGKIVLIQNADPGYDWIFSHNIIGLITEFGGAASHMAIRAAEFKLPSAIGCGSTLFNFVNGCKKIELNCASRQVKKVL